MPFKVKWVPEVLTKPEGAAVGVDTVDDVELPDPVALETVEVAAPGRHCE